MITLDLLNVMRFRRRVTSLWLRRECHARGIEECGIVPLLTRIGVLKRVDKSTFLWVDDMDAVDLAERIQTFLVCHTEEDYAIAAMSMPLRATFALMGEGTYHADKVRKRPQRVSEPKVTGEGCKAIVELIRQFPGISPKEIADFFPHKSYNAIYSVIRRMADDGQIVFEMRTSARGGSRCLPVEVCA